MAAPTAEAETPLKNSSKRPKTPKRPQTAFKPHSRAQSDVPTLTFVQIVQVLANLNYQIASTKTLESLCKEEILEIFVCLVSRINEKYLFDVSSPDFNRSFLKLKGILRELGLSTAMSKQSFAGSFKKPLLFYMSQLIAKLYQNHGGKEAMATKQFASFKQQLTQFKAKAQSGNPRDARHLHSSSLNSLHSSNAPRSARARSSRSRRQSVPTSMFYQQSASKPHQTKPRFKTPLKSSVQSSFQRGKPPMTPKINSNDVMVTHHPNPANSSKLRKKRRKSDFVGTSVSTPMRDTAQHATHGSHDTNDKVGQEETGNDHKQDTPLDQSDNAMPIQSTNEKDEEMDNEIEDDDIEMTGASNKTSNDAQVDQAIAPKNDNPQNESENTNPNIELNNSNNVNMDNGGNDGKDPEKKAKDSQDSETNDHKMIEELKRKDDTITVLTNKIAEYANDVVRLETQLKQQKILMQNKTNEFGKARQELERLQSAHSTQQNELESAKMVQNLIQEKNATIELLASQQAKQTKEMQIMRQQIEQLTFEKEKEKHENLQLKAEITRSINKPLIQLPSDDPSEIEMKQNSVDIELNPNGNQDTSPMDNSEHKEDDSQCEMEQDKDKQTSQQERQTPRQSVKPPKARVLKSNNGMQNNANEQNQNQNGKQRKKRKVLRIGSINYESLIRGKKLNDLRMLDLRQYLKANGLSLLYRKKSDMVTRIENHYYDRVKQ